MWPLLRGCYDTFHILSYNRNLITAGHVKTKFHKNKTYTIPKLWKSTSRKKSAGGLEQETLMFEKMVETRRQEALRSILVQVHSEQSCADLQEYCSQFGEVKGLHHYTVAGSQHYVLVEFNHKSDVNLILEASQHISNNDIVPVCSPFLWFRTHKKSAQTKGSATKTQSRIATNGIVMASQSEIRNCLQAAESLSEQIMVLHRMTCLSDLGSRLRFFTARQIESALTGMFPNVTALPFGSSVNGFGKAACDLDLVLLLDGDAHNVEDKDCRLVFQAKTSLANGRSQTQRYMEMLGDMCQLLLPGCSQVRRILQARVPIIKFHQDLTDVECDLSMTNMSAVHMSELLYVLGACDWRVQPLMFAVRTWARQVGLTNPAPGRWITNFSLTLLVLFYLQQQTSRHASVLPTVNTLISLAGAEDRCVTPEGVNCTFLRDISRLRQHIKSIKKSPNTESLQSLFSGFFEFYSSFEFGSLAISLISGGAIPKPEHSPLYIANPLERGFNVSKNVSHDETERLRIEIRNAAWMLESVHFERQSENSWGLNALFESSQLAAKGRNIFYVPTRKVVPPRIVDVSELFQEEPETKSLPDKPVKASAGRRRR